MNPQLIAKLYHAFCQYAEKTAMVINKKEYSYATIYKMAVHLSYFLNNIIQGNAVCVILSKKSIEFYIGMIASFFSGLIYTPLNIYTALNRNKQIIRIANPTVIFVGQIDENVLINLLSELPQCHIIFSDYTLYQKINLSNLGHNFYYVNIYDGLLKEYLSFYTEANYAYLFFTSGSTGMPKGVPITYNNLYTYLNVVSQIFNFSVNDRMIQIADIAFDISIHEILVSLLSGGVLYVYDDTIELNAAQFLYQHSISHVFLVPSSLYCISEQCQFLHYQFPFLKITLVCGEAFPLSYAKKWRTIAANTIIANLYGPTEATIACCYHIFQDNIDYGSLFTVPIGFPFSGTQLSLTKHNELVIHGAQVADGYWLENQLHCAFQCGVYLTGDSAVFDPNFGYIFYGRKDDQWQIKGYRVEKVEVEAIIRSVCNKGAIYLSPHYNAENLIDYLIAYSTVYFNLTDYHHELRQFLPDVAIPKVLKVLIDIPKLPNGKINYKAFA